MGENATWLKLYAPHVSSDLVADYPDTLAVFRAAVARAAEAPAIYYFDTTLSYRKVDAQSNALAVSLLRRGVRAGDRVALYLQNTPYFLIAALGAWKAGAVVVPINPMNRERELGLLLNDSRPVALICHDGPHRDVVARLSPDAASATPRIVFTTSPPDLQTRDDPRLFAGMGRIDCPGTEDLGVTIERHRGEAPPTHAFRPDDIAFLVYATSLLPSREKEEFQTLACSLTGSLV